MFQLAVVAVVLSAWYGGLGPGLLSCLLSGTAIMYFMLEPRYSLAVKSWDEALQLGVFFVVALLMSALSDTRRQAEVALRLRSEELEAANKELEAFSYSVSHDLRRPLRAIDGYSRILMEEHATHLAAPARRYLELVRACTQETGQLVDDLLDFAKLGRQALHKRRTDPIELVRQALDELMTEHEGRDVKIAVQDLPVCEADPALLKLIFINLLQNALKFTRAREKASIEVGWNGMRENPVYYVKDNGVGFSMEYVDQLFGVFQRLHRSEEYEGTGVGLAMVQRIVQRHGGMIWAEAERGTGATFYFNLQSEKTCQMTR
jgi:light-regulated signal transduction histidine kinase (bacteriophytochrome)